MKEAEDFVGKNVQKTIERELKKSSSKKGNGGHYGQLKPVQDASGIWVVGERLTMYNAMTADSSLQRLLPSKHPATRLFMQHAHQTGGHRGCQRKLSVDLMPILREVNTNTRRNNKIMKKYLSSTFFRPLFLWKNTHMIGKHHLARLGFFLFSDPMDIPYDMYVSLIFCLICRNHHVLEAVCKR